MAAAGPMTLWIVPSDAPGLSVPAPFDGLGLRGNASSPVSADAQTTDYRSHEIRWCKFLFERCRWCQIRWCEIPISHPLRRDSRPVRLILFARDAEELRARE